ncbi:MAG: MmgE/PrpD family protein [Deltaproteobacteria bacterium]|nr:MmgE/PrpD family protein [Deltaproteobacteria bacterium]
MGATQVLAEFVSKTSFANLPKEVVHKAKGIILDTLGCGIAGYSLASQEFHWIFDLVKEMGGSPESTVFIEGMKTSCPHAALVNGTLIHTIDFDDTHVGSISHLGAPVISSALAMGEKVGGSGPALITAVILAYEVASRIGKAIMLSHYKYWHPTGTLGTIAAAVATSKLLHLKADQAEQAISLAADGASGLRYCIDFGDFSKSLHPGLAAWNGIMAAQIIARGAVGPRGLLEYKSGFCEAYSDEPNMKSLTENLGTFYEIMTDSLKAFPTILISHGLIQATLKVMADRKLRLEDLETIHCRVTPTAPGQGINYSPENPLAAKLSIPYCVTRAAADGYIAMDQFREDKIGDPKIWEFMKNVTVEPASQFHEKYPGTLAAQVEIQTKDGRRFKDESIYPKGHPQNPMTDDEIKEKFRRLSNLTLDPNRTEQIIEKVYGLENLKNTKDLVGLLIK